MNRASLDEPTVIGPHPIRVLGADEVDYPTGIRRLPNPPPKVFIAGSLVERDRWAIAVVGSRRASPKETAAAFSIGRRLAERQVTVVSGLARGIDTAAHRGALSVHGGRTIAVVATGLDVTFPPENADLDHCIRQRGAVISQVEPRVSASRDTLLARNKLVAALAIASVVVVAEERSGTRNEIGHTITQRKPVVFWEPSMGHAVWAHDLVSEGFGFFVDDVDTLLERLGRLRETEPS